MIAWTKDGHGKGKLGMLERLRDLMEMCGLMMKQETTTSSNPVATATAFAKTPTNGFIWKPLKMRYSIVIKQIRTLATKVLQTISGLNLQTQSLTIIPLLAVCTSHQAQANKCSLIRSSLGEHRIKIGMYTLEHNKFPKTNKA